MTTDERAPSEPPTLPAPRSRGRFTSEVMAGGSVVEKADDELVGGWRGALGVLGVCALIGVLAVFSIWWFVFVVGVLVAIFLHELGHFSTARRTGMKATQFFIGFGPRLWSFRRGETEYGVRALPLGAFVRIVGMNSMDAVEPEDEARTYRSKSFPKRLLVISAGSIMHMILAVLLLFVVYVARGEDHAVGVTLNEIAPNSPAAASELAVGDRIVAVDGRESDDSLDFRRLISRVEPGDSVELSVLRDEAQVLVSVTVQENTDPDSELFGRPYVGITSTTEYVTQDHSIGSAAVNSVTDLFPTAWQTLGGTLKVLNPVNVYGHLVGTNNDLESRPTTLPGVVGISDDVGEAEGIMGILFLLAILNVFVGVFNMLPLLPLDGGHAAIATYERLRERNGKRYYADVTKLMPFAMAVMTLLLFLFATGLWLDITDPIG